jgi:LuxR family transcriptional regulator, maltose regulon positive regulatory protein
VTDTILTTKLFIPSIRSAWVNRQHLNHQLDEISRCKLTLISAPAGFGKTTLISTWLAQNDCSVVWVSLDEHDNDSLRFWHYIVRAIQTTNSKVGQTALHCLQSQQPSAVQTALTSLLNELAALQEPLVIILDDYHTISSRETHENVFFLLDHLPPQVHLVILTRVDPPFPLARLRIQNQLMELRAADLRFDVTETAHFLNEVMDLELRAEDVNTLETRTDGWIVGLQLAALSLKNHTDKQAFVAAFAGSNHYVVEYLTEEVLRQQPEPVQQFLLQTSIAEQFCASLCDAITDNANGETIVSHLHQNNLFVIPLDNEHRWYRYHHLFGDMLRNLLRRNMSADDTKALHGRASVWYEQQGLPDHAVDHAIKAEDYERVATLIEKIARTTMLHGRLTTLMRWLETIPDELLDIHPTLRIHQAWTLFLSGRADLSEPMLLKVRDTLQTMLPSPATTDLQGEVAAYLAIHAATGLNIPRTIAEAEGALGSLSEGNIISRTRAMKALAAAYGYQGDSVRFVSLYSEIVEVTLASGNLLAAADALSALGTAYMHMGQLHKAVHTYSQIVRLSHEPLPFTGAGYVGLAATQMELNDLTTAKDNLIRGLDILQHGGIGYSMAEAYVTQARLLQAFGDFEGASEAYRKAESANPGSALLVQVYIISYRMRFYIALGELETAQRLSQLSIDVKKLPIIIREIYFVSLAYLYLAQDNIDAALALCKQRCDDAEKAGRMARVIEFNIVKALALSKNKDIDGSLKALEKSLSLAAPAGYVCIYLDGGKPLYNLLGSFPDTSDYQEKYVAQLLAAFENIFNIEPEKTVSQSSLIEPLSNRELEILQMVADGHSNQEIADELIVTLHTIKKHTSNIYGKLGVSSRTQAVAHARGLNLL